MPEYEIVHHDAKTNTLTRVQVSGYLVALPGLEEYEFFAHKRGTEWQISEARTGRQISRDCTRKAVIESAMERFAVPEKRQMLRDAVTKFPPISLIPKGV